MKLFYFLFPALAFAQLDFSIYYEIVLVKTTRVPDDIKKALDVHPLLNYTEINSLKYPDNIVRESNILNHLYDNYWPECKSQIEKDLDKICVSGLDENNGLDDMKYLYKMHRQYLKNIYHVTSKSKCRVCDPLAYWLKLRLDEYNMNWKLTDTRIAWSNGLRSVKLKQIGNDGDGPDINRLHIEVNKTQPQLREITHAVELSNTKECPYIILRQLFQLDNMFEFFYQVFLRDRRF